MNYTPRTLENDRLIRAALGKPLDRPPVWMMRQAGRILPEYREVRAGLSGFKELVETPEKAAEVTLQPVDILGVDAAIIFSDILVVPEAMGLPYEMEKGEGPIFYKTIKSAADVDHLAVPDPTDKLKYVLDALQLVRAELGNRIPLIGFAGAPWTILAYMVEGSGSKTFSAARKMLYANPTLAHALLQKITDTTIAYLKAQVANGADLIQIFDSWAGILPREQYLEFSLPYIQQIGEALGEVPFTIFAKGAYFALPEMLRSKCNTVGLDWQMDIDEAAALSIQHNKTLQGNLDPCLLYANDETIVSATQQMIARFPKGRHIANLGHGVYPDTDWKKAKLFIDTVKAYRY